MEMEITITLTEKELHDLKNRVQVDLWRAEMGQEPSSILAMLGQKVVAAASSNSDQPRLNGSESAAMEYAGKYFAAKSAAEHLEVQNALLLKAVQQLAHRGAVMQSALIENGLVKLVPPPVRLLEGEWSQVKVSAS